jgi:DNA-binding GntR family transcriptional regulator
MTSGSQPTIPSVDRQSLPDKVAEALREAFVTGALAPGTRLIEAEIAQTLSVSRGALREALRTLEREGLVEVHRNRGTYVAQFTADDIEEIYGLRSVLETYAVRLAAKQAEPEWIEALSGLVAEMDQATAAGDYARAANIDLELHRTLWAMSGNQRLVQTLTSMQSQIRMFLIVNTHLYAGLVVDAVTQHRAIVAAVQAGDGAEAARLMEAHIDSAVQQTRAFFPQRSRDAAAARGQS